MMRRSFLSGTAAMALALVSAAPAQAQWHPLASPVATDLSGVSAVDDQIAWASGAGGTVLLTLDGGHVWRRCATPPGAERLDLRGVQAFDKDTAVAMASGKGSASALFKTTDGCATWKQVLANSDAGGTFQALRRATAYDIYLLGEPVDGRLVVYLSHNAGDTWTRDPDPGLAVPKGGTIAAGGGGALTNVLSFVAFGAAGDGAPVYTYAPVCKGEACTLGWTGKATPLARGADARVSSIAGRNVMVPARGTVTGIGTMPATTLVAVGGDPRQPDKGFAAFSTDGGTSWKAASASPVGYRWAVEFDGDRNRFIAIGPNGTDVSVDDGLIWAPMHPAPGEPAQSAYGWTAMSLPFVVGPQGRIGKLSMPTIIVNGQK